MDKAQIEHVKLRESLNAFEQHNFNELISMDTDKAHFKLELRPECLNPFGMIHGGAIATLADNTAGVAAHTDGRLYVTQTATFHYIGNQSEGTIYSKAEVRHRGRSTVLIYVEITGDEANHNRLLATAEFTMFCVGEGKKKEG